MKSILSILVTLCFLSITYLQHNLIIPVKLMENKETSVIAKKMQKLGLPSNNYSSVDWVAKRSGLSPEFLVALIHTESSFEEKAVSSKGYKGLMQIPHSVYDPDANILIGAKIFNEKLKMAKGNVETAISLYKGYGYDDARGKEQARKVLRLYDRLVKTNV